MEQHNIDSRFKENLENFSRKPSEGAWERLQNQMANTTAETAEIAEVQPEEKEERKLVIWWRYAAAAVLLLASLATFRFLQHTETIAPELAVNFPISRSENTKGLPALMQNQNTEVARVSANESRRTVKENKTSNKTQSVLIQPAVTHQTKLAALSDFKHKTHRSEKTKSESARKPIEIQVENPVQQETQIALQTTPSNIESNTTQGSELIGKPIEVVVKKDENQVLLASTELQNDSVRRKGLNIRGIVQQARNLKNGEGLHLADLGVNTDKMAYNARSLQQKVSRVFQNQ